MLDTNKTKKWFMYGIFAYFIGLLLVWAVSFVSPTNFIFAISVPDINVRSQLESGVGADFGSKLVSAVQGVLPVGTGWVGALFMGAIASGIIFVLGAWIVSLIPRTFNPIPRVALVGALGSAAISLLLNFVKLTPFLAFGSLLVAMVLYFAIIGFVAGWLGPKLSNVPLIGGLVGNNVPDA